MPQTSTLQNQPQDNDQCLQNGLKDILRATRENQNDWSRGIEAFLSNPLASLPQGVGTETGQAAYSSLTYDSAEKAEAIFKEHLSHVYARNGHPAADFLIKSLTRFEPHAVTGHAVAHGMTSVAAVFDGLVLVGAIKAGDRIVVSKFLFGSCRRLIDQMSNIGIEVVFIDGRDLNDWKKALNARTKIAFFETPGNPTMELVDIRAVADLVHSTCDALVVVDNSLEFPAQAPLSLGADITVASLTKALGPDIVTGGGMDSGGALLLSQQGLDRLKKLTKTDEDIFSNHTQRHGGTIGARSALEMIRRLPYLEPRFARQSRTSKILASHIAANYPSIDVLSTSLPQHAQAELAARQMKGSVLFTLDLGSREQAFHFINALLEQGLTYVNNFYSYKTTLTHPASTTHHSLSDEVQLSQGLKKGHVRVSVGVEDPDFLIAVFDKAMVSVHPK
jgi:O-succinylhomoserine sulfhydrylase